jgi:hypothetical protein
MRKTRRGGIPSGRDADAEENTLDDVTITMPPSQNIAAMKQVHRQRAAHTDTHSPSGFSSRGTGTVPVNDVEAAPVDALTGAVSIGKSTTTTASGTESNINGGLDSAKGDLVDVTESDITTASADTVNTGALPVLASATGTSPSAVDSVVKIANMESGAGTGIGTGTGLSVGVSPILEIDLF